jgi:hypothetical protein
MARRSKVPLFLFTACLVLGVASFGFWRVAYFVLAAFGIWLLGFLLLSLLVVAWSRWQDRGQLRWVDRLDIDESGVAYADFDTHEKRIAWCEVSKVVFYHGEPDYPDPQVGMAPVRYWELTYEGTVRSLDVPDLGNHSQRLASWCSRKLAGFDRSVAEEVLKSPLENRWVLWEKKLGAIGLVR